jgi:hypothetical protein
MPKLEGETKELMIDGLLALCDGVDMLLEIEDKIIGQRNRGKVNKIKESVMSMKESLSKKYDLEFPKYNEEEDDDGDDFLNFLDNPEEKEEQEEEWPDDDDDEDEPDPFEYLEE